jgi:hypothetical protein
LVVILLLLAVWGGVGAWWLLSRPEGRSTDSIGSFRHQLTVLERTGPTSVAPAFRMRDGETGVYGASRVSFSTLGVPARRVPPQISRRRRVQKRRRDVFYGLLAATVGAAGLGFLPGLSVMWWLSVLLAVVVAVYIVVLVQLRAATLDRAPKLRSIGYPPPSAFGSFGDADPPYLLRRSAN